MFLFALSFNNSPENIKIFFTNCAQKSNTFYTIIHSHVVRVSLIWGKDVRENFID